MFISRDQLAQHWPKPWFKEYAVGAFIRLSIGVDANDPTKQLVYRICEIMDVLPYNDESVPIQEQRIYTLVADPCDLKLKIRHANAVKLSDMKDVSNGSIEKTRDGKESLEPFSLVCFPSSSKIARILLLLFGVEKKEYSRFISTLEADKIPLPTKKEAREKALEITNRKNDPVSPVSP